MTLSWRLKWYSILISFFPILNIYGFSNFSFLTFADYLLIFFILINIIENRFKLIWHNCFTEIILYLVIEPFLLLIISSRNFDFVDALGTAWKLAFYIVGLSVLIADLQKKVLIQTARIIGVSSTIYGLFQYLLGTYAHISLSPYLPFLPIVSTGLDKQQEGWIAYNWIVRPRAWFSEPSKFAIFLIYCLMIELFIVPKENRNKILCVLFSFGIIISRSSTGVFALFILMVVWMITIPEDLLSRIPKKSMLLFLILLPVCFVFLFKGGYIESFIGHTFVNGQGIKSQSHFVDIGSAFSNNSKALVILFGNGMQNIEAGYLPGWFRAFYCLGIIGVILFLKGFYSVYKIASRYGKIIMLTFVALNFGTEIMFGVYMLLFMSLAMLTELGPCSGNKE